MFSWLRRRPSHSADPARNPGRGSPTAPYRKLHFESLEGRTMLTGPEFHIYAGGVTSEANSIIVGVWLDGESAQQISVDVEIGDLELIANRMATPGEDYYLDGAPSGVFSMNITFAPFETQYFFNIGLVNDTPHEGKEWFSIQLSNPVNAHLGDEYDDYTTDVWIDDTEDPYIVISNVEVREPQTAEETAYASFRVEMVGGYGGETSEVTWTSLVGVGDTATSGSDFVASSGTVTAGGSGNDEILVPLNYDGACESPETFRVSLTSSTNGITIMVGDATATILDAIAVPTQPSPPDGQFGPVVGRSVTALSSSPGGGTFWEGDTVAFAATVSAGAPLPGESFVWERRALALSFESGEKEYFDWQPILTGTTTGAYITLNEPFIGQIRVKLISGDTVSSQTMNVRWQAAYPVNFHLIVAEPPDPLAPLSPHLDHRRLAVSYAWSSSSGRLADLDGVKMGEFVWMTDRGFWSGQRTQEEHVKYIPPNPPFVNDPLDDGKIVNLGAGFVIEGRLTDFHGGGTLSKASSKWYDVRQYYWYEITDGATYISMVAGQWGTSGDARGEQKISQHVIVYSLRPSSTPNYWEYWIEKSTFAGTPEAAFGQLIHKDAFPWDRNTND